MTSKHPKRGRARDAEAAPAPSAFENAVAILRKFADTRKIPVEEIGRLSHYGMLHAQQKGISESEALNEIVNELEKAPSPSSLKVPETAIHSHKIAIITDPIPEIGRLAKNGIAKITKQDYIDSLRNIVRAALENHGLGHLFDRLSVHPVEVRTCVPGTADYMHIVELAGDPDAVSQANRLWAAATH